MDCCIGTGIGRRRLSREGESLYNELNVSRLAGEREINTAYRGLALQYHPDKNPGNQEALDRFKEINRIHKILTDENKKRIYDEYGSFGLFVAEKYGDEEVATFSLVTSLWFQLIGLFTCCFCCGCCFCLCCNCCCGLCCKDSSEDQNSTEGIPSVEDLEFQMDADGAFPEPIITDPQRRPSDTISGQPIFTISNNHT